MPAAIGPVTSWRRPSGSFAAERTFPLPLMESDAVKILHVTPSMSPQWGGPAFTVASLTGALLQNGVRSEIVTTIGRRVGIDLLPTPGVTVHSFPAGYPACLWAAYSRPLARFLDDAVAGFDMIHIHSPWHYPGHVAAHLARRHGIPYVVSPHGALNARVVRDKRFRKWAYLKLFMAHILQSADALHAVAQGEQAQIARFGWKTPVFVSPNGINPDQVEDFISVDASGFLATYPHLAGKRVILYLGRLRIFKGLDELARSFAEIAREFEDAALVVAGEDVDGTRRKVEKILRTAGVLDRVTFTGMLTGSNKLAAFSCADLFVLLSLSEGFSNTVVEALTAGLPVVISEQCNFPEVAEAEAGFVVPPEGAPAAGAIRELLSDADLRKRMGRNGRRLVLEHYTWPAIAESMADLYRTLIRKRAQI